MTAKTGFESRTFETEEDIQLSLSRALSGVETQQQLSLIISAKTDIDLQQAIVGLLDNELCPRSRKRKVVSIEKAIEEIEQRDSSYCNEWKCQTRKVNSL